MVANVSARLAALEGQAERMLGVFTRAGYERIAPDIIQPAEVFLDVIGEDLRSRTYVFTDREGSELCLRPDLTVPTCLLHLTRHGQGDVAARYCYSGSAFRFQPMGDSRVRPREFRQLGLESFAAADGALAEVEIVRLTLGALEAAGLKQCRLRFGDVGLFHAILDALDLPDAWRARLKHHFWRPEAFRSELDRLSGMKGQAFAHLPSELMSAVNPDDPARSEDVVGSYLDRAGIELVGSRSLAEITAGLMIAASDARAKPMPKAARQLIERYLMVNAPIGSVAARLRDLMRDACIDISPALQAFEQRLDLLTGAGIDMAGAEFSAEFGRNFEYYTGYVFEVVSPVLGPATPVAGGGRYDNLMRMVGSAANVDAVGAAIYSERLYEIIEEAAA